MYTRIVASGVVLLGALLGSSTAGATAYTVACGANGPSDPVQNQINAIASSPNNSITVTGTCVGNLTVTRADRLSIANLSLTGSLTVDSSVYVSTSALNLSGDLFITNSRNTNLRTSTVNGGITATRGSYVNSSNLAMTSWSDASGVHDPSINCIGQSECSFSGLRITASGTGAGNGSAGVLAASASRLNVFDGVISGFDIGVMVWNHATAFLTTQCLDLNIQSNFSKGVYVTDGGTVKLEGLSAADAAASGCGGPSHVYVTHNGSYGVLADGGGNAYLFQTAISGHTLDGVKVQHGSTVRVRSSTIDAASTSGRSARVTGESHLYFDEQANGPAASSTLAGPVCVTGNSSTDTDNSSTVITTTATCTTP